MTETNQQVAKSGEKGVQRMERPSRRPVFAPPVDIIETPDEIILRADLPGVDEKSIDCTLESGVLTLRASARDETPPEMRLIDGEFVPGDFERVFSLSEEIDQGKIRASVKNGVLDLHLPKSGTAKARKIQISTE
ncbi:MAG: Hsp20/alpha crystallin family protein [Opitutales bacterium]